MLDIGDVIDDGLDPLIMGGVVENALQGIAHMKSREAKWLMNALERFRDDCDDHHE